MEKAKVLPEEMTLNTHLSLVVAATTGLPPLHKDIGSIAWTRRFDQELQAQLSGQLGMGSHWLRRNPGKC